MPITGYLFRPRWHYFADTMRTARRGKRARKVYAITPRGREHFLKLLAEPSPPVFIHDEAQVKIYFGHHNPESAVAHMDRMHQFNVFLTQHLSTLVGEMEARGCDQISDEMGFAARFWQFTR